MIVLSVPEMTSGKCSGAVEGAIRALDPRAMVNVDVGARRVSVLGAAPIEALLVALEEEGYSAEEIMAA